MSTSRVGTYILGGFLAELLPDNYYQLHETVCDICYNAEASDCELDETSPTVNDIESHLHGILPTSTVRPLICQHVFHEKCLVAWLNDQTSRRLDGNCPMCRRRLIHNPAAIAQSVSNLPMDRVQRLRELDERMLQLLRDSISQLAEELSDLSVTMAAIALCVEERASIRAELAATRDNREFGDSGAPS
jgi:hypothetical protein